MTDEASEPQGDATTDESLHGAVIAGVDPRPVAAGPQGGGPLREAVQAPLVVVHVDVTRFVTYEDPDGYVHSAPIDINIAAGEGELAKVQDAAASVLGDSGPSWTVRQLVGDPAMAIKHFADQVDARLIVVGTRKRGFGESVREFFTGCGRRAPRAPAAPPDPGRAARGAGARRRGDLARIGAARPCTLSPVVERVSAATRRTPRTCEKVRGVSSRFARSTTGQRLRVVERARSAAQGARHLSGDVSSSLAT